MELVAQGACYYLEVVLLRCSFFSGALFTFISVAQVCATVVGSAVYFPFYIMFLQCDWPSGHPSGATFLLMALVYALSLPLLW